MFNSPGPLAAQSSVVVVAAFLALAGCSRSAPPPAARHELAVTVTTGRTAEVPRELAATGDVVGWQEAVLAPEIGGLRVIEVLVEAGDQVRKGQDLVRLSTELLAAETAARGAALRQAEADAGNAAAALRRGEAVVAAGALSAAELDRLRAAADAAAARVEAAGAELTAARTRLGLAHIRAPDDGIITSRQAAVGQVVQVGTELLRFLRRGRLEWRAGIPESEAGLVQPGQRAVIVTPAGRSLTGTVRRIGPWVERADRMAIAYVDLEADPELMSGMFARGRLLLGQSTGRLVPAVAVVNQDGYSYVFVPGPEQRVARRQVETGATVGTEVEILSGLKPGEQVVDRGAGFLKDGDRVRVVAAAP
ncbi:MAG: efflux RND transporter periplasmic adaptor subunit [Gammaproteobacteria bacterium]|nr:MAG: efflux RND transporter periplasmic adaptor subunit [Gammaproteobacteria bacterium]